MEEIHLCFKPLGTSATKVSPFKFQCDHITRSDLFKKNISDLDLVSFVGFGSVQEVEDTRGEKVIPYDRKAGESFVRRGDFCRCIKHLFDIFK